MIREPETRLQLLLHAVITLVSCLICGFFSIPAAVILFAASALQFVVAITLQARRNKKIQKLSDTVDAILHGAEHVDFQEFQEGELGYLSSEIHKMTIRLREQNHALKQEQVIMKEAMEDISHQLRTPLTSMMLVLDMLRTPDLPRQERHAYLRELLDLLTRMQWLIETLLNLSRLEAGAVTFRQERIRCRTLIRTALEPLLIPLELKDITICEDIEGDPSFEGDMQYCAEALGNLLKNCMEHTPAGGSITIRATENAIYTGLLITDTGEGIAPEALPHLFERFYRASAFGTQGFGIGLAFARKVVTSQKGSLQARNAEKGGAQFDMRFYK